MDTAIATLLGTSLGSLGDTAVTQMGTVLPIGIGVVATVAGVFFAIKLLRGMIKM